MYKTISIQNDTYQQLHALAARLHKPKAQVLTGLIRDYIESMEEKEAKKLKEHNAFVAELAGRIKLPKGTRITTQNMDEDFSALQDL